LLEGKNVNLRIMEKEDLPFYLNWVNDPNFFGDYLSLQQKTKTEMERDYGNAPREIKRFFIEKKDGTRIGVTSVFPVGDVSEIGYSLLSDERGKGYCTEAITILVDYIFLSRDTFRIQASTDARNVASQKVLERVGFKKEGIIRKMSFIRGERRDLLQYSILREEWKEPRILTKTT
jgi:ribosomal-protein-alanine N-acetyltransferase